MVLTESKQDEERVANLVAELSKNEEIVYHNLVEKDRITAKNILNTHPSAKKLISLFTQLKPQFKIKNGLVFEMTNEYFAAKEESSVKAERILTRNPIDVQVSPNLFKYSASKPFLKDLLETREGQCISYSTLFTVIARMSGLKASFCEVANFYGNSTAADRRIEHVCSAVFLKDERILFDLTHGRLNPPHTVIELSDEHARGRAYAEKGCLLGQSGNYVDALEYLEKGLELYPKLGSAWRNKGVTLDCIGKTSDAIECYKKATELEHLIR